MSWHRRRISFALVGAVLIQTIGCATIPGEEKAKIYSGSTECLETNAIFHFTQVMTLDGEAWAGGDVSPGRHTVRVRVLWSNLFEEETDIELEAFPGKRYHVYAMELKPGQDSSIIIIKEKSIAKQFVQQFGFQLFGGFLAYVLGPAIIVYAVVREFTDTRGCSRPFEGCCFIWIEDWPGRDVVAGDRPGVIEAKGQR